MNVTLATEDQLKKIEWPDVAYPSLGYIKHSLKERGYDIVKIDNDNRKTVCISGGVDPIHSGHINYIQEASKLGRVIFILNSDKWLVRKKGYAFQTWSERASILRSIAGVSEVVKVDDTDGSVCEALERIKPDFFANGGDRFADNIPEKQLCEKLGIEMIFNVGGGKSQSSSKLITEVVKTCIDNTAREAAKWW
jgi:glycerol-3-phosphate cytidylyltransferase-like family protein